MSTAVRPGTATPPAGAVPDYGRERRDRRRGLTAQAELTRCRVVIADGDPLARRVLRDSFQAGPGFAVAAEASDGTEAVELAMHYRPDVVLMEVALARVDGIEATRRIVAGAPEVRVLVYAARSDDLTQFSALRAGASGFISKEEPVASVIEAVRGIAQGEAVVSPEMTMSLLRRLRGIPPAGSGVRPVRSPLTTREWEVLDLVSAGHDTPSIARGLRLSQDTVATHLKHIARKLDAEGRPALIAAAHRLCRQHAVAV